MKSLPITIIVVTLAITLYILFAVFSYFDWFVLLIVLPFLIALAVAIMQLTGDLKSPVAPVSGAIACVFALYLHYETFTFAGYDGQVVLGFVFAPIAQMIAFILLSLLGYFGAWLVRACRKRGAT